MKKSHQFLVLLLIIFGACNTILLALQNKQKTPDADPNVSFFHPFIQTALVFFAESLCFIPYIFYKVLKPKNNLLEISGFRKPKCPIYMPLIPGTMDLFSSILAYISLNLISGSVWQISRGGVIITTTIFSKIFLNKRFTKESIIGCCMAFIGITLVQLFEVLLGKEQASSDNFTTGGKVLGIIFLLVSLIFNTAHFITEKMIFNKYEIHPFKMVFLEGIYALCGITTLIVILQFVQCPNIGTIHDKCINVHGEFYIESFTVFIEQISKNSMLLVFVIGSIATFGISVPLAVTISKLINPISRSLADVCRTVIIWGVCLALTIFVGEKGEEKNNSYILESTGLLLNLLKLIGFTFVIVGTMIYHEMISIFKPKDEKVLDSLLLGSEESDEKYEEVIKTTLEKYASPKKGTREELI